MFNRSTEIAIAAMSRLAEAHGPETRTSEVELLTAEAIARDRNLPQPFLAKVLTVLSQRDLVRSVPGRGGGYALARPPEEITLYDIAVCFERFSRPTPCPFGPGHCGGKSPCPLHDKLYALREQFAAFLRQTPLGLFRHRSSTPAHLQEATHPEEER